MSQMQQIGIVGCGLSGCAIARVVALAGYDVHICEMSKATLELAFQKSSTFFKRESMRGALSEAEVQEALSRIRGTIALHDLVDSDIIIEALPENFEAKVHILQQLDRLCPQAIVFLSHTSSLSVNMMAKAIKRPERVAGLHFIHPIHIVKLVEIVKTPFLDPLSLETVCAFIQSLNREPIVVADSPGFVVSRLVVAYLLNAVRMLEQGIASQADIDKAMQMGCGHPIGPFALIDFLGVDRVCLVAKNLYDVYQEPQYLPPKLLTRMVEEGHLGKQVGQGFYTYPKETYAG